MFLCRRLLSHPSAIPELWPVRSFYYSAARYSHPTANGTDLPLANQLAPATHSTSPSKLSQRKAKWSAYDASREAASGITELPPPELSRLIRSASTERQLYLVLQNVLQRTLADSDKISLLQQIMNTPRYEALRRKAKLQLVEGLGQLDGGWDSLSLASFELLMESVLPFEHSGVVDIASLERLLPEFSRRFRSYPQPSRGARYTPPSLVRSAILYIRELLACGGDTSAIQVFGLLLKADLVEPLPALVPTKDARVIILLSLAKSCADWQLGRHSVSLLTHVLRAPEPIPPPIFPIIFKAVLDSMHDLLLRPHRDELRQFLHLMRTVHTTHPLPDAVVHRLYSAAYEARFADIARKLFKFINRDDVMDTHQYPAPPPEVCRWLLEIFQEESAGSQFFRSLISQIIEQEIPLPIHDRGAIIKLTAENGLGHAARTLWSRYSQGPDAVFITGASSTMLKMVGVMMTIQSQNSARALDRLVDREVFEERAVDAHDFANEVLDAFKSAHHPIAAAAHETLTSFARACFIIGRPSEGFGVYALLSERKITPDFHDINVILKALAERSPRSAARMIDQMIDKGFAPPRQLIGTVMHHALEQNDTVVFYDLMRKVDEMDIDLSPRTMISIMRWNALAAAKEQDHDLQTAKFLGIFRTIKKMKRTGEAMSPHLGLFLARIALKAERPLIAFRFWSHIVHLSAPWDDTAHGQLRTSLAKAFHFQHRRGQLSSRRGEFLLRKLQRWDTKWQIVNESRG